MASMSVRDRAKLFGDLASTHTSRSDDTFRKREFGNVVSSSPFLVGSSPKSSVSVPLPAYSAMSPRSVPYASNVSANSPQSATSAPFQQKQDRLTTFGTSPRTATLTRNSMDWPIEDSIPAPSSIVVQKKLRNTCEKKVVDLDYLTKPVILPLRNSLDSPLKNRQNKDHNIPPYSPAWNNQPTSEGTSPFKIVPNKQQTNFFSQQSPKKASTDKSLTFQSFQPSKQEINSHVARLHGQALDISTTTVRETVDTINIIEKRSVVEASSEDLSLDRSTMSDNENKAPEGGPMSKARSRVVRLMKARKAGGFSPVPSVESKLKRSLDAAKNVMEEEKSIAGSSNASSRSSLSNNELSNIATRALQMSKDKKRDLSEEIDRPGSVRGTRTISKVSHQEARLALLSAAKKQNKNKEDSKTPIDRLEEKADRVVKMKKANKPSSNGSVSKDMEINASESNDSNKSRRSEHPALAARASPKPKAKLSSDDIMSSFRQFTANRGLKTKSAAAGTGSKETSSTIATNTNKFYLPPMKLLSSTLGSRKTNTPRKMKDPLGKTTDRLSTGSGDNSLASHSSSIFDQEETMHSMQQEETIHSMNDTMHDSLNQDETMHSTSERHYLDSFYQMGKVHVNSKSGFNDAYLSSLSSNTFSNQSIMSQSVTSTLKSPAGKQHKQAEKVGFLLDPTPEDSNQTMKSDIIAGLSPGPSNRSARSFANSINSASPAKSNTSCSPTFKADFDTYFNGTLKEKDSDDLLENAIDAAVDGIVDFVSSPVKQNQDNVKQDDFNISEDIEPSKQTIEPMPILSPKKKLIPSKSVSILPNASGRSHSPPGFVFNDSEESDVILPPDPQGSEGLILSDDIFGIVTENEKITDTALVSINEKRDQIVQEENPNAIDEGLLENQKSSSNRDKQGSSSTKQTASTSIRTGYSSIQDEVVVENTEKIFVAEAFEGSSSIRTGLSGLQKDSNEMEKSISFHAERNVNAPFLKQKAELDSNRLENRPRVFDTINKATPQKQTRLPETIHEENDAKSAFTSDRSSIKDEQTSFSGFRVNLTSTTDTSGASGSSDPVSSYSENATDQYTGYDSPATETAEDQQDHEAPLFKNLLPPIYTEEGTGHDGAEMLSPASRKSGSWKGANFGKRVGDAIKNVLAKASPRASGPSTTPSSHVHVAGNKRQESRSLFSSVDDEEDIFGGLEDDNTAEEEKVVPTVSKTPKNNAKTPKQKNSKSGNKKDTSGRSDSILSNRIKQLMPLKSGGRGSDALKLQPNSLPKKHERGSSSPTGTNPVSLYSNDRSGTVVDESHVLHNVNSDITSSLIGGPISGPTIPTKQQKMDEMKPVELEEDKNVKDVSREKPPRSPMSKSKSSRKSKSSKISSKAETKSVKGEKRRASKSKNETTAKLREEADTKEKQKDEEKPAKSMFMNLSCGGFPDLSSGFANLCNKDDLGKFEGDEDIAKDYNSVSSHSRLTDLEKKVWSEWDRLNGSVLGGPAEEAVEKPSETQKDKKEQKEDHDKKREAARDKLLDIASTALSSHLSGKTGNSTNIEGGDQGTLNTEQVVSTSTSSETRLTKDTGSGASGSASATESGGSAGSSTQESSQGYSTECSSGLESDFVSEDPTNSPGPKSPETLTTTAGPILLSFSQRSLMDKFSKQLSSVGVEVLKLNRRKQWQVRYFTVSKEQIALSAHEAISKTGEIAHCPKALLWLKKFNPRNEGYSITNIDKDGHGGMLLVDLVDIQVSDAKGDTLDNPPPKKLSEKFRESVLVTLQYKMNRALRSIEFRCKDNDEAQFLCTCMRVIRDLLRRERSLRQKSNKLEKKKKATTTTATPAAASPANKQ